MTRISAILGPIGVMVLSSTCTARQLVKNGACFCTAELSGGLYYNQSAKVLAEHGISAGSQICGSDTVFGN
jgi:hypothetical protein